MGLLYYGDNLDILRRYVADASVELVYLDPPFNSAQTYNAFFQEKDGLAAASQIKAFEDTWEWNLEAETMYNALTEAPGKVSEVMQAFRTILGSNDMMAYLAMMAPRLVELRRVLKPTGSLYLHCDPTASHYLKLLLDAVFGREHYRNEIIWERTTGRRGISQFGRVHDVILFYTKSATSTWNEVMTPQDEHNARGHDMMRDKDGLYRVSDLSGAGQGPARIFGGLPIAPPSGRHWQFDQAGIDDLWRAKRIVFSRGGKPRLKTYLKNLPGVSVRDVWTDIDPVNASAAERLGYPTQKPLALLERIVAASSNPGDVVLDPFCGCGTTVDAAIRRSRRWIGIDITQLAITEIKARLQNTFGESNVRFLLGDKEPGSENAVHEMASIVRVIGEPVSLPDAEQLANDDKYQFQWWALGLVGARPVEEKKGADKGIDGKILFRETLSQPKPGVIIFSVKGGGTGVKDVRDLRGVIERDGAAIGVLITLHEPTGPMKAEAAAAGFYESKAWNAKYPRLQLRTVEELLAGEAVKRPPGALRDEALKRAPRARRAKVADPELEL